MNRTQEIIKLRKDKTTLKEIGKKFSITKQRVSQILQTKGISGRVLEKKTITTSCKICKKEVQSYIPRRFCSQRCYGISRRINPNKPLTRKEKNKRNRERYKTDPEYRARINSASVKWRKSYPQDRHREALDRLK